MTMIAGFWTKDHALTCNSCTGVFHCHISSSAFDKNRKLWLPFVSGLWELLPCQTSLMAVESQSCGVLVSRRRIETTHGKLKHKPWIDRILIFPLSVKQSSFHISGRQHCRGCDFLGKASTVRGSENSKSLGKYKMC